MVLPIATPWCLFMPIALLISRVNGDAQRGVGLHERTMVGAVWTLGIAWAHVEGSRRVSSPPIALVKVGAQGGWSPCSAWL